MCSHKGSDGRRFLIEDFPLRLTMANIRLITLKILIIVELMDMRFSLPSYLRYIKYLVAAGIVVFGAIVTQKVLEILAP